jgi:hypothetical protein
MSVLRIFNLPRPGMLLALALCGAFGLPCSHTAHAQDPTAKADPAFKSKRASIMAVLREQTFDSAEGGQQSFDDYFNNYALLELFPTTTPTDKAHYTKARKELKTYFSGAKGGPPRARLNELTLEMMKAAVASDDKKFDLAAKINAMLVIGELNEVEAKPAAGYAPALDYLLEYVAQKRPADPNAAREYDALRVTALVGIERLASGMETTPLPPDAQAKVRVAMLKIVATPLPKGPARAGHDWLRGNAAEVLGSLKEVGPQGAVVTALDRGVADPDSRLRARCQMAEALGLLKYPTGSKIDYSSVAGHLGQLAYDACAAQTAKTQKDKQSLPRRQLKTVLKSVMRGLNGPVEKSPGGITAAAAATPHKDAVAKVTEQVQGLLKLCDNSDDDALIADLQSQLEQLQKILATLVKDKTAVAKKVDAATAQPTRPGPGTAPAQVKESAVSR